MTVHARRYGRWCREHFDTEPESGEQRPAGQDGEAVAVVTDAQAQQAQAGDAPEAKPGSLS
ncbi:hypothetical protein ACFQ05_24810 [Amycolatopsis umgeniensis]|uniref:Uncharacterized protein n=1 Tax=Amycolatopsis umgeniensis TaxID=336628 RepID=A0A841BBQ0_9PSEU|nr:hypothetical protein [Amycolatopsis umgeniensis]MBB5856098.1 hypothetical protein [Amycolatopsis umgeniensis]